MAKRKHTIAEGQSSKFFGPGKLSVYFDQDSASNLTNEPIKEGVWTELREVVSSLYQKRKIIIPVSLEHFLETSRRHVEKALNQDQRIRLLSSGYGLRSEYEVSANQISSRVRNQKPRKEDYFCKNGFKPMTDSVARSKALELVPRYEEIVKEINELPNLIKDAGRVHRMLPREEQNLLLSMRLEDHSRELQEKFSDLEIDIDSVRIHYQAAGEDIPCWKDVLGRVLARHHRLKSCDFRKAREIFASEGLRAAPSLYIRMTLSGLMDIRGKKQKVNDAFDIARISVALPACDVVVTDGPMANLIEESSLGSEFGTDVYSGREESIAKLVQNLNALDR